MSPERPEPVAGLTDADLVARCRAGDEAAWAELVERFSRYVYAIAVQGFRLGQHDAEDVYQEVFLRVYERLASLRNDEALRPWIAQVTRRVCLDRLSARGREHGAETATTGEQGDEESLRDLEEAMDMHAALAALGLECSELLDRFFARDESYRVIAAALDLPMGTVASRISRCLGKLRRQLDDGRNPAARQSGE